MEQKNRDWGLMGGWGTWAVWSLGVAIVLWRYAQGIWPWMDETAVALNLVNLNWAELLGDLRYGQSCPIGYLWGCKACMAFLPGLYGLRLFSVVGYGIGTWFFVRILAVTVKRPLVRTLGMAVVALSPGGIAYALNIKQYGWEWTVAAGMVWAFLEPRWRWRRRLAVLAALGCAGAFLSTSVAFMMAGIGLGLWARMGWSFRWREIRGLTVLAVLWTLAMGVESFLLWDEKTHAFMVEWWTHNGGELGILWGRHAQAEGTTIPVLARHTMEAFSSLLAGRTRGILWLFVCVGILGCLKNGWFRKNGLTWVVLGMGGTHLLFGATGIYPVAARLCWYASWIWFLLAVLGMESIGLSGKGRCSGVMQVGVSSLTVLIVLGDIASYNSDGVYGKSRGKETIRYLKEHFQHDGSEAFALPRWTRNQVELMTQLGEVPESWRTARWPNWDESNMFDEALGSETWVCCNPEGAKVTRLWVQDRAAVETGESRLHRWARWLRGGWGNLPAETDYVPMEGPNQRLEEPFLRHLKDVHGFVEGRGEIVEKHWGIHYRERVAPWERKVHVQ